MSDHVLKISDSFWNIRGVFKIGGVLNIGTQASLVRLGSGRFVLLDAYTLRGAVKDEVDALTSDGADIEAIINLHPFHTVHVERAHRQYPQARLYGTLRHLEKFPDLPWEHCVSESDECAVLFAGDLDFSVPAGVDFISHNEHLHFSSVLAYHRESRTIHVDDTLMYLQLPGLLGSLRPPQLSFHPTLARTLEKRPGAAQDFRDWATHLADRWADAETVCAAHSAVLAEPDLPYDTIAERILAALARVEKTLQTHERKYG